MTYAQKHASLGDLVFDFPVRLLHCAAPDHRLVACLGYPPISANHRKRAEKPEKESANSTCRKQQHHLSLLH